MARVFSKEKWLESIKETGLNPKNFTWPDRCYGKEVLEDGTIVGTPFVVYRANMDKWTIELPDTEAHS